MIPLPAAAALLALAGCVAPPAAPPPFAVLGYAPGRLALEAAGRTVVVAPPEGRCVDADSVALTADAAVVMLRGCGDGAALRRTILVGPGPLADDGAREAALDAMAAKLAEPGGWRAVGLGAGRDGIEVLTVRRAPGALFVVVQDAAERRCRAFTEIGDRMAVVTVAAETEHAPEALMAEAATLVAALRGANPPPSRLRAPVWGAPPRPRPDG